MCVYARAYVCVCVWQGVDVIIFHPPRENAPPAWLDSDVFIKRVSALAGDTVEVRGGWGLRPVVTHR